MNPVIETILQRWSCGLVTLFVVSAVIFSVFAMRLGDFAKALLGQAATPETVAAFRARPAASPELLWIDWTQVLQGDLASSFASPRGQLPHHAELIGPKLHNTIVLAGMMAVLAVPLALGLGVLAALYRNGLFDRLVNGATPTTISILESFVAYLPVCLVVSRGAFAGTELAQSLAGWLAGTISWLLNLFSKFPNLSSVRERTSFSEHP
jgi:peptide/nickel transport system permease protein